MDEQQKIILGRNSLLEAAELSEMGGRSADDAAASTTPAAERKGSTLLEAATQSDMEAKLAKVRRQLVATQKDLAAARESNAASGSLPAMDADQDHPAAMEESAERVSQAARVAELEETLARSQGMVAELTAEIQELQARIVLLQTDLQQEKAARQRAQEHVLQQQPPVSAMEDIVPGRTAVQAQVAAEEKGSDRPEVLSTSRKTVQVMPERLLEKWIESE